MPSAEDRTLMGNPEAAEQALIALAREWRELRQPSIATAKQHKEDDRREYQIRFELANAALLWLWHKENSTP